MKDNKTKITFESRITTFEKDLTNLQQKSHFYQPRTQLISMKPQKDQLSAKKNNFDDDNVLLKKMSFNERETMISKSSTIIPHENFQFTKFNEKSNETSKIFKNLNFKNTMIATSLLPQRISLFDNDSVRAKELKKNQPITFESLFKEEDSQKNTKKFDRILNFKRSSQFSEKIESMIKNKTYLRSNTNSLRNEFFKTFTQNEIEVIHQNTFKNNFNRIKSVIKIDKKAFNDLLIKKSQKPKLDQKKSFLSDSEEEHDHLLEVVAADKSQKFNKSQRSFEILDQDEIKNKIDFYSFFTRQSVQSGLKTKSKTLCKSYRMEPKQIDQNDQSVKDCGKFLYINPHKNN